MNAVDAIYTERAQVVAATPLCALDCKGMAALLGAFASTADVVDA